MSADAASARAGDQPTPGTNSAQEMASQMPSPDGMELVPDAESPGSPDPAPQTEDRKDWEQESRTWQGRFDKLSARYQGMDDVLDAHGIDGATAATALQQYDSVLKHPELGKAVTNFLQTGQFQPPETRTPEEIEDETLEKPWLADLRPLQEENAMLRAQLEGVQRNTGGQAIERLVSDFKGEYPLTDEQSEAFHKKLDRYLAGINTPQGLAMIQNPSQKQFRPVLLDFIEEWRSDIEVRRAETTRQGLQAMATDAPPGVATTGAESPAAAPAASNKAQAIANARRAAARAAQRG